ncbi:hypothetical protein [Gemmobacter sp. 24YEA27]|uniref:hypothetical protein n=1 Tax=Gemmobacter sp. 24YEA27 TaxID=3040672 RepID=UPI0024B3A077|nr:hypothetical protein [Gemmobacter sp. 24YEA27]
MLSPFFLCLVFLISALPAPGMADLPRPLDNRHMMRMVLDEMHKQAPDLAERYAENLNRRIIPGKIPNIGLQDLTVSLREETDGARREQLVQAFASELLKQYEENSARSRARPAPTPPQPGLIVPRIMLKGDLDAWDAKPWKRKNGVSTALTEQFQVHWGMWQRISDKGYNYHFTPECLKRRVGHSACNRRETVNAGLANLTAMTAGLPAQILEGGRIYMVMGDDAWSLMLQNAFRESNAAPGSRIVAAMPRTDLILWVTDPDGNDLADLRQLTGWAMSYAKDADAVQARYKADLWARHAASPDRFPPRLIIIQNLSADLMTRIGPQLWDNAGWAVLAE